MARPALPPDKRLSVVVQVRMTPGDRERLAAQAKAAGVSISDYLRETAKGNRPRAKARRERVRTDISLELTRIATNLRQLETATGDETYGQWAHYVGGQLLDRLLDRPHLVRMLEDSKELLNSAGVVVNSVARRANMGKDIDPAERDEMLAILKTATEALHEAARDKPGRSERE
ncbi:plasmid mobilization protein [Ciceribacter azotifigens]|uniref:plasmid mobilization protein n=1 Tax=Ciceribacter azotifigens TaxID=2069303 RepID=UPI003A87F920